MNNDFNFPISLIMFLNNEIQKLYTNTLLECGYLPDCISKEYVRFSEKHTKLKQIYPLFKYLLNTDKDCVFVIIYDDSSYYFEIKVEQKETKLFLKEINSEKSNIF